MIQELSGSSNHDASWLAIRQPAVIRLLEAELSSRDGDAFAAGLALACRVLGRNQSLGELRLDHHALTAGMTVVRAGLCDRATVRSLRAQIAELPVALTRTEEDAVATVLAAIIWAVLDSSLRDLDDILVA
jgi:hypothetical protein